STTRLAVTSRLRMVVDLDAALRRSYKFRFNTSQADTSTPNQYQCSRKKAAESVAPEVSAHNPSASAVAAAAATASPAINRARRSESCRPPRGSHRKGQAVHWGGFTDELVSDKTFSSLCRSICKPCARYADYTRPFLRGKRALADALDRFSVNRLNLLHHTIEGEMRQESRPRLLAHLGSQ